jgi:iron complex outermembrane receptor protein
MRLKVLSIMTLVASGTMFSFAYAAENSLAIEEVVVTARKQEESSQDVPIAMTAISEQLQNSTIRSLTDLNGFAPNVTISEDGSRGGGGAVINIRGISPTRSDDNSFDAPIGVMIDGVYLGTLAGQVLENFDLERVEILRGPQGTLFGKNTVGGVVNVIRSRPTGVLGARLKATIGEDGQQEFRAVVNTPVIEDVLAAKFFYTKQEDDGFMKNITLGGDAASKDYQNYGAAFLWTPNDRFEATMTVEKFLDKSNLTAFNTNYNVGPGVLAPPTDVNDTDFSGGFLNCIIFGATACRPSLATPKYSENDTENKAKLETDAFTLTMRYDLNENMTLVSTTGYRELQENRIYDFDGSAANFITIDRENEYDQMSQELRIDGSWDTVTLSAGLYYFQNEFTQDWATGGAFWGTLFGGLIGTPAGWDACQAGAFAPTVCDTGVENGVNVTGLVSQILFETQETTSIAAFAQADWQFAEKWTLTAGLRWTEEKKDFQAGQSYLTSSDREKERNFPEYANLEKTWTELSPKIGLTYELTDSAIVFGSYSEGFHSGGFFGVNQNIRDFVRDQYEPEIAKSWELGYKAMLMDRRLRLNISAFRNDFTDKQESSVQVDNDTKTVQTVFDNVADAIYQGIELETEFVVSENLKVFFNYGYLDAEYDSFETDINASDGIALIEDASFLTPRNAPKYTLGVGGTLTFQVGNGDLEIYAKYSEIDDVESNLLNTPLGAVDSREDVTASIGYYAEKYSIVAFGRNLTDEQTEVFTPISTLFAVGSLNRGRHYGMELSYTF